MAIPIGLPSAALPGLREISKHASKLGLLTSVAEELPRPQLTISAVARSFSDQARIPTSSARDIVTQILSLHTLRAELDISPAELFDAITESLETRAPDKWAEDHLPKWRNARSVVETLLSPASIFAFMQKTVKLRYDYQFTLIDFTILSDIRPIFDDSAQELKEFLITQTLGIEYSDGTRRHRIYLALDAADVAKLKKACERAETKTATTRATLASCDLPVMISGEFDDD